MSQIHRQKQQHLIRKMHAKFVKRNHLWHPGMCPIAEKGYEFLPRRMMSTDHGAYSKPQPLRHRRSEIIDPEVARLFGGQNPGPLEPKPINLINIPK
ncbi:hypothetical protein TNCV_2973461 [Trichonephila clavipes]|nr:hypothetical protein TNCV_2973461 [Trichonephila clavipes]